MCSIHALSYRHPPPPRTCKPSKPLFRSHSQQSGPQRSFKRNDGPIYLPLQTFKVLSQDAMKALKAYNTEAINRFHQRKVHNTEVAEISQGDSPQPSVPDSGLSDLPESNLAIPHDPILDFVNGQCHSSEDLHQVLKAYQGYKLLSSQNSTPIRERSINYHYTYHVAQASQAKHVSLVDGEPMVNSLDQM